MYHLGMQTYIVKIYLRKNIWRDKLLILDYEKGQERVGVRG